MPKPSKLVSKPAVAVVVVKPKAIDLDKLEAVDFKNDTGVVFDAKAHGLRALAMIRHVEGLKKERAVKAILAGIYLAQVKHALGHGEFNDWCAEHLGQNKRSGERYMALAAKFSRSSRMLLPELVGANQLSLDLTNVKDAGGKAVLAKLDKFVGNQGLTDLMQRHEVIKQGGHRPQPVKPAGEAEEEGTVEEAEASARAAGLDAVETARKALLDDVLWHDLTEDNAGLIETKLKLLTAQFHERYLKLKHEAAA